MRNRAVSLLPRQHWVWSPPDRARGIEYRSSTRSVGSLFCSFASFGPVKGPKQTYELEPNGTMVVCCGGPCSIHPRPHAVCLILRHLRRSYFECGTTALQRIGLPTQLFYLAGFHVVRHSKLPAVLQYSKFWRAMDIT